MILCISNSGEILPIAYRLKKAGQDVAVYVHSTTYRSNYDGILDKIGVSQVGRKAEKADTVIVDITRPNERTRQDLALLRAFGCRTASKSVFGPVAGKIRKHGTPVIGASRWTEELELDRRASMDVAKQIGLDVPEYHDFDSLKEGAAFLEGAAGKASMWVMKPHNNQDLDLTYVEKYPGELLVKMQEELPERVGNGKFEYLLQKKIDGVELSTEAWFDGKKWLHLNHTIEDKRLMNSNLGPAIGSQGNSVWMHAGAGPWQGYFDKLTPMLQDADYAGPIDINAIVTQDKVYFLEFSPRFGYDALYCLLSLLDTPLEKFFTPQLNGSFHQGFASSQRISVPPFPYHHRELLEDLAKDVPVEGEINELSNFWLQDVYQNGTGLRCAGSDGIIGVAAARGNSLGGSVGNVYRFIDTLKVGAYLQYRTDGGRRAEKALKQLQEWKINV